MAEDKVKDEVIAEGKEDVVEPDLVEMEIKDEVEAQDIDVDIGIIEAEERIVTEFMEEEMVNEIEMSEMEARKEVAKEAKEKIEAESVAAKQIANAKSWTQGMERKIVQFKNETLPSSEQIGVDADISEQSKNSIDDTKESESVKQIKSEVEDEVVELGLGKAETGANDVNIDIGMFEAESVAQEIA